LINTPQKYYSMKKSQDKIDQTEIEKWFEHRVSKIKKKTNRNRRKRQSSLSFVFEEVKARIALNNISIQEICDNTKVERDIVELIFSEDIVDSISRIIQFTKVKITLTNTWSMDVYHVHEDKSTLKITRKIEPKAHMYYDKKTGNFYNFFMEGWKSYKNQTPNKIIVKEMAQAAQEHINNTV